MKSLIGKNALTVFLSESKSDNLNMFFCPYTRNNVVQYVGNVEVIYPSYDTVQQPNVIIRPQKLSKNIHYIFTNTKDKPSDSTSFYIQHRTFDEPTVQVYYCYNCQAPQLYFSDDKVVKFDNKSDVKIGDEYVCSNPLCKTHLKYLGTVSISNPVII
jgi:hypothetical protein